MLRNSTVSTWEKAGRPASGQRPGEGEALATDAFGRTVVRYEGVTPRTDHQGDIEAMSLWAGQAVGLVTRQQPAAEIVRTIMAEAEETLKRAADVVT